MKSIRNLTEDQAIAIAAQIITRRAVSGVAVRRDPTALGPAGRFAVEVDTYAGEEEHTP